MFIKKMKKITECLNEFKVSSIGLINSRSLPRQYKERGYYIGNVWEQDGTLLARLEIGKYFHYVVYPLRFLFKCPDEVITGIDKYLA